MQRVSHFLRKVFWSKGTVYVLAAVLILFVAANAVVFALYRSKTYPGTKVGGTSFGNVQFDALSKEINARHVLPTSLDLQFGDAHIATTPKDLGLRVDSADVARQLADRHWLPLQNLWQPQRVTFKVTSNNTTVQTLETLTKPYYQEVRDADIVVQDGLFTLVPARLGIEVDAQKSQQTILNYLRQGQKTVRLSQRSIAPAIKDEQVKPAADTLRAQQNIAITFAHQGKTARPSPADIANWYKKEQGTFQLSDAQIQMFLQKVASSFGITANNADTLTRDLRESIQKQRSLTATLTAASRSAKTFTYCIQTKNVDASAIPSLRSKLVGTYADSRGWSTNGRIAFKEVTSGCNFTVWLSAADQMPTFGAICDSTWSCRVGSSVVINFDRWRYASDAWNASGGSLDDYRSMVIHHETGHWLGFGHAQCSGAGRPAAVMQQQSISLEGCVFNPWPLASEQQQLLSRLGL